MLLSATVTNLVQNGSFENPDIPTEGFNEDITPANWSGIVEIQDNVTGLGGAAAGAQHVELDGDSSGTLSQVCNGLTVGGSYTFKYYVRLRPGTAVNPTSPVRLKKTVFSWVSWQKFPLHFLLDYFRGQFEAEFFQQDLLVVSGF